MAKPIEKILKISSIPKQIRNICTSAHIHHGKTAFSDNLIAAAGMMSQDLAGDALMLNFREDEIERCMTIDSSNISMVHDFNGVDYLVNLIDTPGHVDFGGDVTRAMRAVDGTILLVCASEGVMPQTETVLKQALKERVKPVLFINKVDRLITELKLPPEKIMEKFTSVIAHVNRLIMQIAEEGYGEKWQVNVMDGSVAFGSAKQNWALSVPYMKKKNVGFKDIITIYENTQAGPEREKALFEKAPLYEVIMDMTVKHLPDPVQAQQYRIPKIWHGDLESEFGKSLMTCDFNGKLGFVINKIIVEPQVGEVSYGRLFSGTVTKGMEVYLNRAGKTQRIQQIFIAYGQKKELVESVHCGNIVGLVGIKSSVGETLSFEPVEPFEEMTHIFEPVISKAIEPVKPGDLAKLVEILVKVEKEDPTVKVEINHETGENIISGMGELHLEVIENRIRTERGLEVKTSPPIVVYRETITGKNVEPSEGKSPNKHNRLYFVVEPLPIQFVNAMKAKQLPEGRIKKKDQDFWKKLTDLGMEQDETRKVRDLFKGNIFVDLTRGIVHMPEIIEMVLDMFEDVCKRGGIAQEPVIGMKVSIVDCKLHEDNIHRGPAQLYPAVREGIREAMRNAKPMILEPLQIFLIEAPSEYMGEISRLVANKRGQLLNMEQTATHVTVEAKMPVGEMFGWSSELRSGTEGRGTSYVKDQFFEPLPMELQEKIKSQIRTRKGLTDNQ
jgi:elongation factor 2